MALCPYCDAEVPEDVVFCLQCGVRLQEAAPVVVPEAKVPGAPPAAICRFCKGPLNLRAEFCEQCGAPLEDAAPPGLIRPKARPAPAAEAPPAPPVVLPAPPKAAPQPPKATPSLPPGVPPSQGAPATPLEKAPPPPAPIRPGPSAAAVPAPRPPAPAVPPPTILPEPPAEPARAAIGAGSAPVPQPAAPPRPTPSVPSAPAHAPRVSVPPPEVAKVAPRPVSVPPTVEPTPPPVVPKAPAVAPPPPEVPPAEPAAVELAAPLPPEGAAAPKKPFLLVAVVVGMALIIGIAGGAGWFLLRPKPQPQPSAPQVAAPKPAPSVPAQPEAAVTPPPSEAQPPAEVTPTAAEPKKARVAKPQPTPAPPPPAPTPDPRAAEIANLQNLAREAYAKGAYAEPLESSAISYAKRVLALAPNDDYAKTILENGVNGGKFQAQQAIRAKDFATAHRVANALAQLLPARNDIKELQRDVDIAEKAEEAARRPPPAAAPILSFRAYHMHSDKAPADKGPYCLGTLSILGGRIKFVGESASDRQVHNLEFACSEAREIKKNARVAARQGGFHIRTASSNANFVPEDSSPARAAALAAACTK